MMIHLIIMICRINTRTPLKISDGNMPPFVRQFVVIYFFWERKKGEGKKNIGVQKVVDLIQSKINYKNSRRYFSKYFDNSSRNFQPSRLDSRTPQIIWFL